MGTPQGAVPCYGVEHARIIGVACGGGFTLGLTTSGAVFAWGKWANGRLGLGPVPRTQTRRRSLFRKQVSRFLLSPRRVSALRTIRIKAIACGEAHALAVELRDKPLLLI